MNEPTPPPQPPSDATAQSEGYRIVDEPQSITDANGIWVQGPSGEMFCKLICDKPRAQLILSALNRPTNEGKSYCCFHTNHRRELAEREHCASCLIDELTRHGFQKCDIEACNCGGWHQTRQPTNETLLKRIEELGHDLEIAKSALRSAERDYKAELSALKSKTEAEGKAVEAFNEIYAMLPRMMGHNHWDNTMQRGAGCPICIKQREQLALAADIRSLLNQSKGEKV